MTTISLSQLVIIILLLILLFGDISHMKKILKNFLTQLNVRKISTTKKNRKKGS